MTAPSPVTVSYVHEADVRTWTGWAPLPVVGILPSVDRDRVPYATAVLTLSHLDPDLRAYLDPRNLRLGELGQVRWRIAQLDENGTAIGYLPRVGDTTGDYAVMHVRDISRQLGSATLILSGAESLIEDRVNILPWRDTGGACNYYDAVRWIIDSTFTGGRWNSELSPTVVTGSGELAETLLARRDMWLFHIDVESGQSYLSTLETKLNAANCRLVDAWGLGWYVASRTTPPTYTGAPNVVKLAASTSDDTYTLPADVDPIITALDERVTRDGNWADAVVVNGTYGPDTAYQQIAHQENHTRGLIIDVDRDILGGNLAESIASRALKRGHDITVTARARFDVLPGMTLDVHLREETIGGEIAAVAWDLAAGTMTITAQSVESSATVDHSDQRIDRTSPTASLADVTAALDDYDIDAAPALAAARVYGEHRAQEELAEIMTRLRWGDV